MRITKTEIFVVCILVGFGIVRFFFFLPKAPPWTNQIGNTVQLSGEVIDPPDVRLTNERITVRPKGQESNVLFVMPVGVDIAYGDMVTAIGVLSTPESFITSSGKEFDYARYLSNQDIYFIIKNPHVEIISRNNGNGIKAYLYKLSHSFTKNIGRNIPHPESDLASGLILGARGGFDTDLRNEFITTGTIHMVALSGYNVTIVAAQVMKVLSLLFSQTVSIVCGIVVIFLFIVMTGASSTAIRAGIMAVIALLGQMTGRTYDASRALVIAALLMIAYDARVVTDISFQLSFIATFGVLFVTPKVIGWVWFMPNRFKLRETAATTIAATITVLPILLYTTGILSLVSFPANILILPLIPFTMFVSFVVGLCGYISLHMSLPFAYIAHILLSYILAVIHFFATLPYASVVVELFPLLFVIIIYGLLGFWVWKK